MRGPHLSARFIQHALIPASCAAFFACLIVSGAIFYQGKPFKATAAIISDIESPEENPHGYAAAAVGTTLCGVMLAPAAIMFFRRLRNGNPKLAKGAAVMLGMGLSAAICVGVLSPCNVRYTRLHARLACAAFLGICGGTLLYFIAARAARVLIAFKSCVLLILISSYFGQHCFNNSELLTSFAFWEWMLCIDCGVGFWVLSATLGSRR